MKNSIHDNYTWKKGMKYELKCVYIFVKTVENKNIKTIYRSQNKLTKRKWTCDYNISNQ